MSLIFVEWRNLGRHFSSIFICHLGKTWMMKVFEIEFQFYLLNISGIILSIEKKVTDNFKPNINNVLTVNVIFIQLLRTTILLLFVNSLSIHEMSIMKVQKELKDKHNSIPHVADSYYYAFENCNFTYFLQVHCWIHYLFIPRYMKNV